MEYLINMNTMLINRIYLQYNYLGGGKMDKAIHKNTKLFAIMRSLLVSYIVTAIILLILALVVYKFDVSNSVISIGVILSYIFSNFIGGLLIGKNVDQKKYIWGIITGVLYFVIIILVSIVLSKTIFTHVGSSLSVFAMCALGGMLGGMVS